VPPGEQISGKLLGEQLFSVKIKLITAWAELHKEE
jgi:hypothetical protein